jgi:hypothetical protein
MGIFMSEKWEIFCSLASEHGPFHEVPNF